MTIPNTNSMLSFSCIAYAAVMILGRTCSCLQFTYPNFNTSNRDDFSFSPGSTIANGSLQITPNSGNISHRSGRVAYARETLKLWNSKRTVLTSFRTEFVLNILPQNGTGEGMVFMLTNNPSLPSNSSGQWLGVCNNQTDGAKTNRLVAVEFDTRKSYKDDLDGNHVGLDLNSIKSVRQQPLSNQSIVLASGSDVLVRIKFDGASLLFEVLIDGAPAPEPPVNKPAFVWPPGRNQREMELPDVGLLFTGGARQHSSFCSLTSTSLTGR